MLKIMLAQSTKAYVGVVGAVRVVGAVGVVGVVGVVRVVGVVGGVRVVRVFGVVRVGGRAMQLLRIKIFMISM